MEHDIDTDEKNTYNVNYMLGVKDWKGYEYNM